MRSTSLRILIGATAVTGVLMTGGPAQAACPVPLEHGHVDVVGLAYEDGSLEIAVHDESGEEEVEYAPEDVLLRALPGAQTTIPADPAYAFLGTSGNPVWILPEVQNPDLLWAGFGAEELESGVLQNDEVDVSFLSVKGPGRLAVYTDDVFGEPETVLVNSGDGLPDTVDLRAGDHTHANWAFSKAGTYTVKVKAAAHLASDGSPVSSRTVTYTFEVQK
ncbi:choice-of-anchor M domain-containing protein [Streptomyces sp. NPDC046984]|uniref:choice-of-anchor M domain-containing protein n=1 Tax=Streptomyces sp. NPDC046984 TaxID=3155138 RepID=UPI0033C3B12D